MTNPARAKEFKALARAALTDSELQKAMRSVGGGLALRRREARAALPEFDTLRDAARDLKNHTLAHLDLYLERFEQQAQAGGAIVHWAESPEQAREIILQICAAQKPGAAPGAVVTKGKSMISEEIELNHALETAGHRVVETDLGEYIIQLRKETPSHIIAPAIHVTKEQVEADFRAHHKHLPSTRNLSETADLVGEARQVLRGPYFEADVGVTGANMLIAETGQSVIVTNEGNGDLTQSLARIHLTIASVEKIVPTLEDAATVLRVLARSATGQSATVYTTFSRGPRRAEDPDGPEAHHIVLIDNGRSEMLGGRYQDMLRCIRCGACMNNCPVYQSIGGHAYGWVYPGPMGAVLTPSLVGVDNGRLLPDASTFCGRCEAVCPMRIPLPEMMRHWREEAHEKRLTPMPSRLGLRVWAYAARRPKLYARLARICVRMLRWLALGKGGLRRLPMGSGWTASRDFPAPEGDSFQARWRRQRQKQQRDAQWRSRRQ